MVPISGNPEILKFSWMANMQRLEDVMLFFSLANHTHTHTHTDTHTHTHLHT